MSKEHLQFSTQNWRRHHIPMIREELHKQMTSLPGRLIWPSCSSFKNQSNFRIRNQTYQPLALQKSDQNQALLKYLFSVSFGIWGLFKPKNQNTTLEVWICVGKKMFSQRHRGKCSTKDTAFYVLPSSINLPWSFFLKWNLHNYQVITHCLIHGGQQ